MNEEFHVQYLEKHGWICYAIGSEEDANRLAKSLVAKLQVSNPNDIREVQIVKAEQKFKL